MPRVSPLIPAFNAGEFSPRMAARVDFSKYGTAAEVLRNMIPFPQGGAMRRPGTRFGGEVRDSSVRSRLLRFQFNDEQAFVIEAGEKYFRFYQNPGRLIADPTDAVIVNGDFTSDIGGWDNRSEVGASISHDAANGRLSLTSPGSSNAHAEQAVAIDSQYVNDPNHLHVLTFQVFGAPGDEVLLRIGTASEGTDIVNNQRFAVGSHTYAFKATASLVYIQFLNSTAKTLQVDDIALLNLAPIEIATPYAADDLFQIKTAQTADVMYLAHERYPIQKLGRLGNSSWSLTEVLWEDGPWEEENEDTSKLLAASATTGLGITITATNHSPFKSVDIGRLVRIRHANNEPGYAVITEVTSATQVKADVKRNFNATTANDKWRLGAWSVRSGYPKAVGFFEQRLYAANTMSRPQTFWASQSADIENMRPDGHVGSSPNGMVVVEDDDALDYTIAADDVNPIIWISSGQQLVLGTFGGEWLVRSSGPVITPNDIDVKRQTTHGSADIEPIRVGQVVLFMQKGGRKLRQWTFDFDVDGYRAFEVTLFSEHVTRSGIVEMDYQEEEDSTVWCVRADGRLATLAYQTDQNVLAWGRSVIGGSFEGGIAQVESVAVIPGNTKTDSEDRDEVWVSVKRTINGLTRRYVEFFKAPFESPLRDDYDSEAEWEAAVREAQKDAFYLDSGLEYSGAAVTNISGLDHLEGEIVKVWADGAVQADKTVTGGAIVLDAPAENVKAGLAYSHLYKSLKLNAGAAAGTSIGKVKRLHAATFVLMDTAEGSIKIGPDGGSLDTLPFREVTDVMGEAVPLFSGEVYTEFDGDYDRDARIVISGDAPAPFTLLAIAPEMKTNDAV